MADWSDFITDFVEYAEGIISPGIFTQWGAIALVAGALERRVWVKMGNKITFPNLYTLLVAPPGVGKFVIEEVRALWRETLEPGTKVPALRVAPDSMSKASLMDTLVKAKSMTPLHVHPPVTYHSLLIAAEEFAVLMPQYDLEYIGALNSIYNNKSLHEESRRTGSVRELKVEYPQLNILAGTQPGWLGTVFPEEAWSTGLTSRMIMVYAPDTPFKELFDETASVDKKRSSLLRRLGLMSQLWGQMKWEPEAADMAAKWHRDKGPPTPEHSKLAHYVRRRTTLHMPKLAIVSAIAATGELVVRKEDVSRAIKWLTATEALMPDIFRSMVGKSDAQVIDEMHFFISSIWARDRGRPLHERVLYKFLGERVPSDKIEKIISIAEKMNVISRVGGTTDQYLPRPKHEHGME